MIYVMVYKPKDGGPILWYTGMPGALAWLPNRAARWEATDKNEMAAHLREQRVKWQGTCAGEVRMYALERLEGGGAIMDTMRDLTSELTQP